MAADGTTTMELKLSPGISELIVANARVTRLLLLPHIGTPVHRDRLIEAGSELQAALGAVTGAT